jgi:hypothetical protein
MDDAEGEAMRNWKFLSLIIFFIFFNSCAQAPGITIRGTVQDQTIPTGIRTGRQILLAVWFEEPREGLRPRAVTPLVDVLVTRGSGKVNEFLWETSLEVRDRIPIYVGAFLESRSFQNSLPDPGEYLGYAGPFFPEELTEVTIVMGQTPQKRSVPLLKDLLDRMIVVLNRREGLSEFMGLIHPFYTDPLGRTIETLPRWLDGSYPTLSTLYTSPLSAPQWGWFSQDIRDRFEIGNFEYSFKTSDEINKSARLILKYSYKADIVRTVQEEVKILFSELDGVFYLRRLDPLSQSFADGVTLGGQEVIPEENLLITLTWNPPVVGTLFVEEYHPSTGLFSPITDPVSLDGSFNQKSIGPDVPLGEVRAPLTSSGYFRFRVLPLDRPDLQAIFFSRGVNYPY